MTTAARSCASCTTPLAAGCPVCQARHRDADDDVEHGEAEAVEQAHRRIADGDLDLRHAVCNRQPCDQGVQGRHHSMFMPPDEARSPEYAAFWEALRRGEFRSAEFMRMGKGVKGTKGFGGAIAGGAK